MRKQQKKTGPFRWRINQQSWSLTSLASDGVCVRVCKPVGISSFSFLAVNLSCFFAATFHCFPWKHVGLPAGSQCDHAGVKFNRPTRQLVLICLSAIELRLDEMFHFNLERNPPPCEMLEPLVKYSLDNKAECDNLAPRKILLFSAVKKKFSHPPTPHLPLIYLRFVLCKLQHRRHRNGLENKQQKNKMFLKSENFRECTVSFVCV
jgi:hypothetical protein